MTRHCSVRAAVLLAALLATPQRILSPQQSAAGIRLSPADLKSFGQEALRQIIAKYGQVQDSASSARIASVLNRLILASGHPGLSIDFAIIGDESVNAATFPGGVMAVNVGLLRTLDAWAKEEAAGNRTAQSARFEAYLAAVLGHELAHATLGHPDSALSAAVQSRVRRSVRNTATGDLEREIRAMLADSSLVAEARAARGEESAADRVGALYLLRAGWEIQDAMNLMRRFDAWEREAHDSSPQTLSWFTTHPRSAAREAALEAFRASLKVHQAEFDDALVLLRNNTMLDSAGAMLDRVLEDFPTLVAALHARAAVLHRRWLDTLPVQQLLVRSSVPTYDARFLPGIRGGVASPLLTEARQAYRRVLARELLPYALSNLAVLDAYAGDRASARARADSALRFAPADPMVKNNRGVVLYLAGDYATARDVFAALARSDTTWIVPQFNLARALEALGDTGGTRNALTRYLGMDGGSAWAEEAQRLLRRLGGGAATVPADASKRTSALPTVATVSLGAAAEGARSALGTPAQIRRGTDGEIWHYPERQVTLGVGLDGRVAFIVLESRGAGDVDGIRVGDSVQAARRRWGSAADATGDTLVFDRGAWYAIVAFRGDEIVGVGAQLR